MITASDPIVLTSDVAAAAILGLLAVGGIFGYALARFRDWALRSGVPRSRARPTTVR